MRHAEYVKEKLKYTKAHVIHKHDKMHNNGILREFVFIQRRITSVYFPIVKCGNDEYNLINLDGFFEFNEDRRKAQLELLHAKA